MNRISIAGELIRRELRSRYLGTFSGSLWLWIQPLVQLAIYGYVFGTIFRARLPEAEFGEIGFTTFLAIGLWPWLAFSESLTRASTAIIDNAGLLGKVAIPRELMVLAPVAASVLLHLVGFLAVLLVLLGLGWLELRWQLLWLPWIYLMLTCFTLGLAWLFAALSVFVRDLTHMLSQVLMLLFFLTPILYPRSLVPAALLPIADANPMALYINLFRAAALGVGEVSVFQVLAAAAIALASVVIGLFVFRRLASHFEDYL